MKRWISLVGGCAVAGCLVTGALAQETPPKSCEDQLLETRIQVEWQQRLQQTAAADLQRWITKAQTLEHQLKRQVEKSAEAPKAPAGSAAEGVPVSPVPTQGEQKK